MTPTVETPALARIAKIEAAIAAHNASDPVEPYWVHWPEDVVELNGTREIVAAYREAMDDIGDDIDEAWLAQATVEQIEDEIQYLADFQG